MKSLTEMDLDDGWELIPDEGFLEIHHDDGGNKIYSRKYSRGSSNSMVQRNYFMCPPQEEPSIQFVEKTIPKSHDHELVKQESAKRESAKIPVEIKIIPPVPQVSEELKSLEQDPVSQVFFKKMENEFVEMKVESPRFSIANEGSELAIKNDYGMEMDDVEEIDEGGMNIWKKGLTGIGAICSFGMAAATVCVIILSSNQKNKQSQHKLQFQIYTSDKRIKKAISASRGVPINKARITVGGRYDADC